MKRLTIFLLFGLLFQSLLAGCAGHGSTVSLAAKPGLVDAQELRLKLRELADQLLASTPNEGIGNLVAMPTSFVDVDHKNQTSALGNLCAESLIYEFNQRGYPVSEYRLSGDVDVLLGQGDFALLRQGVTKTAGKQWAALMVGTYAVAGDSVFVNGRLVRASDGMVLRTGQVLLPKNELVASMLTPIVGPSMYAGDTQRQRKGHGGRKAQAGRQPATTAAAAPAAATAATTAAADKETTAKAAPQQHGNSGGLASGTMRVAPAPWTGTPPYKQRRGPRLYGSPIHY